MSKPNQTDALLNRGIKLSHLRMMAAFAEAGQIGAAAQALGITQPAASRLLSEIERIVGTPVHSRSGRGVSLTVAGQMLARRADRVLMEMRDAAREMAEAGGGQVGTVGIGAVTAPALDIVLPALRTARLSHPGIQTEVVVASSDILFEQLLSGRIDFAIARIPNGADATQIDARVIAAEPVALMVRKGHRLANAVPERNADLLDFDWVMPGHDSPLGAAVLARLAALGLPAPQQRLSTASFLLTLALLQQSNSIAPLAQAVANQFASAPDAAFAIIRADIGISVAPYSLLTRRGVFLPPAARTILGLITQSL
jgi:DNA-binding transcriptional LysR family regulator